MGKGSRKPEVSKKKFYVATVSHGKDSAYMVVYLLSHRDKYPLDLVLYVNTGMEFDAVYEARDRCCKMLKNANIPYVEIDIGKAFQHSMFSKPVCKQGTNEVHRIGYSWCGGPCRWGTSLKLQVIDRYCKNLAIMYDVEVVQYVGIAYDEKDRIDVDASLSGKKCYPLVEAQITEAQCLKGCYEHGFTWMEDGVYLYEILDRLSCWCCRNKNLKELKAIYFYLSKYWNHLKELESRLGENMKAYGSLTALEGRFRKTGRSVSVYDICDYPVLVNQCNRT